MRERERGEKEGEGGRVVVISPYICAVTTQAPPFCTVSNKKLGGAWEPGYAITIDIK